MSQYETIALDYTIGLTKYPLYVELYFPEPGNHVDAEMHRITLQSDESIDLFDLFEAIRLPPTDPTAPSSYGATAADALYDLALERLRGL